MPIEAVRSFRLGLTVALALVIAYGSGNAVPYLAPLLAFVLTIQPSPPMPPGKLLVIALALGVMLGLGLLVAPLVEHYPLIGIILVAVGLFVSAQLSLGGDKAAVGTLLAAGLTLVSAIGVVSLAAAQALVLSLVGAVITAVVSQWLVYPLFPEPTGVGNGAAQPSNAEAPNDLRKRAWKSVLIALPAYLFLLTNPTGNTPIMMKSIVLSQTGTGQGTRAAGIELLSATCLGGIVAIALWFGLKLAPTLWLFGLWTVLAFALIGGQVYRPARTRFSAQFWMDTGVTVLILLGPAVADSANGKDPYQGFLFRFGLFLLAAVYAWATMSFLDRLGRSNARSNLMKTEAGAIS